MKLVLQLKTKEIKKYRLLANFKKTNVFDRKQIRMDLTSYILNQSVGLLKDDDQFPERPLRLQEKALAKLLRKAAKTQFGKNYNFQKILATSDPTSAFKTHVPIHSYDKIYDEWWSKSLEGQENVTWSGRVKYFALSSGTSGAPSKYIPVTQEMQQAMRRAAFGIFSSLGRFQMKKSKILKDWLMIGSSATLKPHNQHCFVGDLSGINSLKPPFWLKKFKKPGLEISLLPTWEQRTEAIVKNAKNWDISILSGIPSWVQLTLEKIIEFYGLKNIHEIWPNLSIFVTGGISFEPYKPKFERLLGMPISYLDTYLASEGFLAFQTMPDVREMSLLLNAGIFYEFIPFNEENFDDEGILRTHPKVLRINEVEENIDYALVISTCAGAWRYLIGDTIKFTNKKACKIMITGRTKHFLSVCGEHLSIDNMNHAIAQVKKLYGFNMGEFSVGYDESEGNHFAHQWYIGVKGNYNAKQIAILIDEELKTLNDDYKAERGAMLQPPVVHLIPEEWFYDWKKMSGKMNGQSKIPRVVKGQNYEAWKRFIHQKNIDEQQTSLSNPKVT